MTRATWLALALVAACGDKGPPPAAPPPLRPDPEPKPEKTAQSNDCKPTDPKEELKPLTFDERSIPEGQRLAEKGNAELKAADSAEINQSTREATLTQAVNDYLTALAADPYNVGATYGLAAVYSKIGRRQCSINLLTRILQMRPHPSKHAEVEAQIDHLLGRHQPLDPDFFDMRRDERFRQLIEKMCEGTNDANCVYGGQKDNRER